MYLDLVSRLCYQETERWQQAFRSHLQWGLSSDDLVELLAAILRDDPAIVQDVAFQAGWSEDGDEYVALAACAICYPFLRRRRRVSSMDMAAHFHEAWARPHGALDGSNSLGHFLLFYDKLPRNVVFPALAREVACCLLARHVGLEKLNARHATNPIAGPYMWDALRDLLYIRSLEPVDSQPVGDPTML